MSKNSKKTEKMTEQHAAERTAASAAATEAPKDTARKGWLTALLGAVFLFVTCAVAGFAVKWVTMVLLVGAIVVLLWRGKILRERMSWLSLAVALFVLMDGVSTLYARSGKFALYEFLKVAAVACVFIFLAAFEPRKQRIVGRCAATVLELAGALASLLSIDSFSTRVLYNGFLKIVSTVNTTIAGTDPVSGGRLWTIFENPNVFSGAVGICILLALGLADKEEHKGWRCLHLSCAVCSSVAFLLALSRGAIAAIGLAFLLLLLLERGEHRMSMLLIMLNVFVFTAGAVLLMYRGSFGEWTGVNAKPLLLTVAAMAAACAADRFAGRRLADRLAQHIKAMNGVLVGIAAAAAVFAVLAYSLTGPAALRAGEELYRGVVLPAGDYTLSAEMSGTAHITISCQTTSDAMLDTTTPLYSGGLAQAHFTVPEESKIVFFQIGTESEAELRTLTYQGASSGKVPLRYRLLPEMVAARLQGAFQSSNFTQRTVYYEDGLRLWKMSPVFGLGMGSFENAIISVQTYHYESKYAHSHYIQTLVEVGAVGFLLWLSILGASAAAVFRMWRRRENAHPMTAACGAALLFMMIHAAVEVDFSAGYFLPFGFGAFAVIDLCCGEALPVKQMSDTAKAWVLRGEAAALGVFAVLLGMNQQAKALSQNATYESLAKAAKMDKYEWADYALSYVYSASGEEEITPEMQKNMDRFLPRLEAQNSNTIPFYLALTYFNLGQPEKAYEMLNKYVDYTASDSQHWEDSFQAALNYYDGSETSRAELKALYAKFNAWNEDNLGTVEVSNEIRELLDALAT